MVRLFLKPPLLGRLDSGAALFFCHGVGIVERVALGMHRKGWRVTGRLGGNGEPAF